MPDAFQGYHWKHAPENTKNPKMQQTHTNGTHHQRDIFDDARTTYHSSRSRDVICCAFNFDLFQRVHRGVNCQNKRIYFYSHITLARHPLGHLDTPSHQLRAAARHDQSRLVPSAAAPLCARQPPPRMIYTLPTKYMYIYLTWIMLVWRRRR